MKAKLYLETTIVSYLVARPSRNAALAADQKATHAWWDKRLHPMVCTPRELMGTFEL
jgi:hypothetical protein